MVELYKIWKIFLSINLFESTFVTTGLIFAFFSTFKSIFPSQLIPVFQCTWSTDCWIHSSLRVSGLFYFYFIFSPIHWTCWRKQRRKNRKITETEKPTGRDLFIYLFIKMDKYTRRTEKNSSECKRRTLTLKGYIKLMVQIHQSKDFNHQSDYSF